MAFFPIFLKYRYPLCGEDIISSSEVHDKGDPFQATQLLVNFTRKVYFQMNGTTALRAFPCLCLTIG